MSARRQRVVFGLALVGLVAGAAVVVVATPGDRPSTPSDGGSHRFEPATPAGGPDAGDRRATGRPSSTLGTRSAGDERRAGRAEVARPTDRFREDEPTPLAYPRIRERAEAAARRFWKAFAAYELGERGPEVLGGLRATATASFARELLAASSRLPAGEPPPPAHLGSVELVPGTSRHGRLIAAELVGHVTRAGERQPLSIALRRTGGGWRVEALGR